MDFNEYFISLVKLIASKSKDPDTKVGALIVDKNNRIISTGYNGFPSGMIENEEMWKRPNKHNYVIHAELNAILYSRQSLENCTLYTTLEPCEQCAKIIVVAGIKTVYYIDKRDNPLTKELFNLNSVTLNQINF